ncbi:SRPBCC family protein [Mycolicibacterium neworleansense]|uniref:Polyketide cyclase / dehydrase and lipid transport n=1 Tax=Mycolicibacterium neworleansense TaxID=146018 RepID=A0A0H5RUV5_9MYCO|nr:SRPBCC family protein [Mycolicibacterium neworleansense]MCV7364118.1 SRPBCC family protein [Mycolicibacterium neworleansense]CRZ17556.1 Polyketide cyclase / dehydrase and lipid transport [Mycolicibacterium neworleansense]
MNRYECVVRRRSTASPATLFAIVSDGSRWSEWAKPLIAYSAWETRGPADDGGVGAIRAVGVRQRPTREMTTIHEPGRRHGYTMLTDGPIRDYQAEVSFTADADATQVTWRGSYETRWRVVGLGYWLVLRVVLGTLSRKLVSAAERHG